MLKRTKIIATLGPATGKIEVLKPLIAAGVDVVRVNLSHGNLEEHQKHVEETRAAAKALGKTVGIMIDLQGPKIRIAAFKEPFVFLENGASFIIDAELEKNAGTIDRVGVDYKNLPNEVKANDILLLDDGLILLLVEKVEQSKIYCKVQLGGKSSSHKGINRRGGGLTAEPLTEKDRSDIQFAAKIKADYVAVSFPRCAADIENTRQLLVKAGSRAGVVAKIERVEAVQAIDEMIEASDGVMVARGDLGVELGYAELPAVQKQIISRARALNRPVITATQMMESMVHQPIPTRAEVSDVANAVLDGTDAVMLSAETATGHFPIETVLAMRDVCLAAERQRSTQISHHRLDSRFTRVDESIAMAAMYVANHIDTKCIVALTETGKTPLWMSRIRSCIPIYGMSRNVEASGRMTLYRGVYPVYFDITETRGDIIKSVIDVLLNLKAVEKGDRLIITKGDMIGSDGGSNTLKIVTVY